MSNYHCTLFSSSLMSIEINIHCFCTGCVEKSLFPNFGSYFPKNQLPSGIWIHLEQVTLYHFNKGILRPGCSMQALLTFTGLFFVPEMWRGMNAIDWLIKPGFIENLVNHSHIMLDHVSNCWFWKWRSMG